MTNLPTDLRILSNMPTTFPLCGCPRRPQLPPVSAWWSEELGERFREPRLGLVGGGVGDGDDGAELLHGEVGPVREHEEQSPVGKRQ
ncbi:hypothetical protein [Streptomyces gibsoniae]|uniref:hypothetical protein n=1 Tax=Streptomyces gibsoniae TaxID=3075529 RepID=UPI00374E1601